MGGDKHIAEMAHVIPHGEAGPRHEERPVGGFDVDGYDNLILLCPKCHTIVDKAPEQYSRATMLSWKRNHLSALMLAQGIRSYADRRQVRAALVVAMAENKAIWREFAPSDGSRFEYDPESDAARTWTQRMRGVILPNHFRMQSIVEANASHLTAEEREAFANYKEHVRGLVERHVCGIAGGATRYPIAMDEMFQ